MCLALRQAVQHREIEPYNTTDFAPEKPLQTNTKAVFNRLLRFLKQIEGLTGRGHIRGLMPQNPPREQNIWKPAVPS